MYGIRPRNVYIHQRVLNKPECVARMERMMTCIHADEAPQVVDDPALNEISREKRWDRVKTWRTGQYKRTRDPDLVFNAYRWAEPEEMAEGEAVAAGTDRLRAAPVLPAYFGARPIPSLLSHAQRPARRLHCPPLP